VHDGVVIVHYFFHGRYVCGVTLHPVDFVEGGVTGFGIDATAGNGRDGVAAVYEAGAYGGTDVAGASEDGDSFRGYSEGRGAGNYFTRNKWR